MKENSDQPPGAAEPQGKTPAEKNPYWGRASLLDWYLSLGLRGKLAWIAGIFLAANGIAFLFGFFWPRVLIAGIVALVVSLLLPRSIDD